MFLALRDTREESHHAVLLVSMRCVIPSGKRSGTELIDIPSVCLATSRRVFVDRLDLLIVTESKDSLWKTVRL